MRYIRIACNTILFLIALLGVSQARADDKPKVLKRGGLPYEDLWKEEDVKKYLKLPLVGSADALVGLSADQIARRIEPKSEVAGYQAVRDGNAPLAPSNSGLPAVTLELRRGNLPVFYVSVYGSRSWNSVCDALFTHITSSVELWNKIPEYYAREESADAYTLTRKGKMPQKWYFGMKERFVIAVESRVAQEDGGSEQKTVAEIDRMIRELSAVIEGKNVP